MKIEKLHIPLLMLLLVTLLSAGCNSNQANQQSNNQVVDDATSEPVESISADVDKCASRSFKFKGGTFVVFGDAALTELATGENGIQAFTLTTSNSDCGADAASGLLVQSSTGVDNLSFSINGVKISLGSTVFLSAPRDNDGNNDDENISANSMQIKTIEGAAIITAQGETTTSVAGTEITVPLDDSSYVSGPPSELQPSQILENEDLPVDLLEYEFDFSEPPSMEELALFIEHEVLFEGIEVQDVDELFEYLTEQDGEDIPEYLINELDYSAFDEDVEEYLQDDLGYDLEEYDDYSGEDDNESVDGEGDDVDSEGGDDEEGDGEEGDGDSGSEDDEGDDGDAESGDGEEGDGDLEGGEVDDSDSEDSSDD